MSIRDLFRQPKPSAHNVCDLDADLVKGRYRYWRFRIFYSMYIGYSIYYFTRKSLTYAAPALIAALSLDKTDFGMINSVLYITYGISKFFSGIQADRSNPRYFMAIGLMLTGVLNIFFGFSASLYMFILFWGLNGWFQGYGWPPCARLLTHWYSVSERGRWWGVWNTCHNLGAALIPWVVVFAIERFGWQSGLYVPGVIAILCGLFLINRLRDTPESMGLPPVEHFRNDHQDPSYQGHNGQEFTARQLLMDFVLRNKFIWILALASFFIHVLRTAVNDWTLIYLCEVKGFGMTQGALGLTAFEWGGFFGSLVAGWASDRFFRGMRGPVNVIFTFSAFIGVMALFFVPTGAIWLSVLMLAISGFCIFGPQMLIGMVAAEISHKKAAGTATGFVGWFAYFGAAGAGYPLGKVIQELGWGSYFTMLGGCAILAFLLFLPLWSVRTGPRFTQKKQGDEAQPSAAQSETSPIDTSTHIAQTEPQGVFNREETLHNNPQSTL